MKTWLDRKQAAKHCAVGTTLFDAKIRPNVPVVLFGSKPVFDADDLDTYLSTKKISADDMEL